MHSVTREYLVKLNASPMLANAVPFAVQMDGECQGWMAMRVEDETAWIDITDSGRLALGE